MKATGRLITSSIGASACMVGGIGASACMVGGIGASACMVGGIGARAWSIPQGVAAQAMATDDVGLFKYLRVTPVEPQQLVWLVPQVGIDYTVESNTNWIIK